VSSITAGTTGSDQSFDLPDGPWFLSPRGDLGYLGYATFPGDNRTFAAVLAVPTSVPQWRMFKDAVAFEAAVARIPALRQWVDPAGVDPITDVLPMAGLRNTIQSYDATSAVGLVPIGDAFCHTDPVLAHGIAFALIHAAELVAALREHNDRAGAFTAYAAATTPALRERYDYATALDEQRHRMWVGKPVDFARRAGDYALFSMVAAGAAATIDPDVFPVFVRRIGLLDSTAVLDSDIDLQYRIEVLFRQVLASPPPPAGPPHEEMLAATTAAVGVRALTSEEVSIRSEYDPRTLPDRPQSSRMRKVQAPNNRQAETTSSHRRECRPSAAWAGLRCRWGRVAG
jgi:hypothetical protein